MPPSQLFAIAWVGWIFTWAAASFWSGRTEKRLATADVWAYRLSSLLGLILLSHFTARALGLRRMWHVGYNGAYFLAALTFGGIFLARDRSRPEAAEMDSSPPRKEDPAES